MLLPISWVGRGYAAHHFQEIKADLKSELPYSSIHLNFYMFQLPWSETQSYNMILNNVHFLPFAIGRIIGSSNVSILML
jgi:hypothetical protein